MLKFGHSCVRPVFSYKLGNEKIKVKSEEKNLGTTVTDKLSPEVCVRRKTGETYNLGRNIRKVINYLDEGMIRNLIVTLIGPSLEYAYIKLSTYHHRFETNTVLSCILEWNACLE